MSKPVLVLGNKRYSSWSLRGYLALRFAELPFDEVVVPLRQPDTEKLMTTLNPNAPARVPSLVMGEWSIWDSLSLMEYAAENRKNTEPLWPEQTMVRAYARSVTAEMHSGFENLRSHIPMDLQQVKRWEGAPERVQADIDRIAFIWRHCREKFGADGPYLFGKLSMADAAYAPVVARFRSCSVPLDDVCTDYMAAVWEHPAFAEWQQAAAKEKWVITP